MADTTVGANEGAAKPGAAKTAWLWHPPLPIKSAPLLVWPPQPVALAKYLVSPFFLWSLILPFGALATLTWYYLQPPLAMSVTWQVDWVLWVFARNLGLMVVVAGGLHLFFYAFQRQGTKRKFDPRDLDRDNKKFFARNQVWDNIFWTCASGVTIWTAYECFFLWAYANDYLPYYLEWTRHPVWFVLMFLAIPFWASFHFYCVHRLLHWPPLYKVAHALHHRNDNPGPWSGLSMHPIEHVLYLSSVLIHVVLMSHPIHILFHNQWNTLGAATSHTGYDSILLKDKPIFALGAFHHQLHHRYYNCNYGNTFTPCDKWFGSDLDGTPESLAKMRERWRASRMTAKT